ncbi:MAG TPA: PEGA domain-containing protein [Polyangia bacterium]|nr:PEGA domain-containing protein [Polyangia bacterium]
MRPALPAALLSSLCILSSLPARGVEDGAWLEKAAEAAVIKGEYPRAVALFRGLTALRPKDPSPEYRLAEVYTLGGQYEEAIGEYRRFASRPEADPARRSRAEAEAKRLEEAPAPFSETLFKQASATPEAKRLFEDGKKDAQAKKWQPAINELQAALLLDPDLPGPYRLLGAVYGKTGDRAQERLFLADYLRVRPDGKIADTVRATLSKEHVLGTISVDASFPCKVYINGRDTGRSTPLNKFALPPGKYVVSVENEQYHVFGNLHLNVATGKDTPKTFAFGILNMKLDPWARVRVDGKDIGLWDEAGIPEGTHTIAYKSHDGSKEKSVELTIKGGARQKLSW